MKLTILFAVVVCTLAIREGMARFERTQHVVEDEGEGLTGQALVDYINSKQTLFRAKLNKRFAGMSLERKRKIIGGVVIPPGYDASVPIVDHSDLDVDIPESFDARTAWPQCPSIGHIRDQSNCGSCWAFGTSEAMSDRICIATNGSTQVSISADDLISCCHTCGNGCNGGNPVEAWNYWTKTGIVTGNDYGQGGCKSYPFPPCEHHSNATTFVNCKEAPHYSAPTCSNTCDDSYGTEYTLDKYLGKSAYSLKNSVETIQKEILMNGPVETSYNVFEDFEQYTGGIYVHTTGRYIGGHAVKTIGWGVENGTPYWLVANSWNSDWGENGFFRIIRGQDECGFERSMTAGLPKV